MGANGQAVLEGALPGAMDRGEGRITFALYAPEKKSVHLIGSFNDWDRARDPMHEISPGYWGLEKHLDEGVYQYQFLIDQDLVICDPYAMAAEFGNEADSAFAVLKVGQEPYVWEHDDWIRPQFRDLIIYEIQIGDFSPEGNFRGVLDRLDYLKELGITAVELAPVYQPLPTDYWGYAPMFFLAPRSDYGTATDLRRLIDQCHHRGLAVILDLVLSHTAREHPFNRMYPYDQSPWFGRSLGGEQNQFALPTFDYNKDAANGFVRDVQSYWLREFHVDGFRYDYLPAVGIKGDRGLPYLMRTAREIRPEAYLIGEYLPEDPDLVNHLDLNGVWHARSSYAVKALLSQTDVLEYKWDDVEHIVKVMDPTDQGYKSGDFMINYLENHDEQRFANRLREAGVPDDMLFGKLALGATFLFTMPGEPMLYQGQEWAEDSPLTKRHNPLHWDKLDLSPNRGLRDHYHNLIRMRRTFTALRQGQFEFLRIYNDQKAVAFHRWLGSDRVVVVLNFHSDPQTLAVPFPQPGRWTEYFSDRKMEIRDTFTLDMEGISANVFTLR